MRTAAPSKIFPDWQERSIAKKKTIFDALDEFTKPGNFNFGINHDFIYRIAERYHFVPSVEDLYWTDLEFFDREKVKHFIQRLLEKVQNSTNVPDYDYVLLIAHRLLACSVILFFHAASWFSFQSTLIFLRRRASTSFSIASE